jgi:hypothetical protein
MGPSRAEVAPTGLASGGRAFTDVLELVSRSIRCSRNARLLVQMRTRAWHPNGDLMSIRLRIYYRPATFVRARLVRATCRGIVLVPVARTIPQTSRGRAMTVRHGTSVIKYVGITRESLVNHARTWDSLIRPKAEQSAAGHYLPTGVMIDFCVGSNTWLGHDGHPRSPEVRTYGCWFQRARKPRKICLRARASTGEAK